MAESAEPDFWRRVVAKVRNIPIEEVTAEQRAFVKTACFAAMYRLAPARTDEETFKECCEVLATAYALKKESI